MLCKIYGIWFEDIVLCHPKNKNRENQRKQTKSCPSRDTHYLGRSCHREPLSSKNRITATATVTRRNRLRCRIVGVWLKNYPRYWYSWNSGNIEMHNDGRTWHNVGWVNPRGRDGTGIMILPPLSRSVVKNTNDDTLRSFNRNNQFVPQEPNIGWTICSGTSTIILRTTRHKKCISIRINMMMLLLLISDANTNVNRGKPLPLPNLRWRTMLERGRKVWMLPVRTIFLSRLMQHLLSIVPAVATAAC